MVPRSKDHSAGAQSRNSNQIHQSNLVYAFVALLTNYKALVAVKNFNNLWLRKLVSDTVAELNFRSILDESLCCTDENCQ